MKIPIAKVIFQCDLLLPYEIFIFKVKYLNCQVRHANLYSLSNGLIWHTCIWIFTELRNKILLVALKNQFKVLKFVPYLGKKEKEKP